MSDLIMPASGGSYLRNADGSLTFEEGPGAEVAPTQATPADPTPAPPIEAFADPVPASLAPVAEPKPSKSTASEA